MVKMNRATGGRDFIQEVNPRTKAQEECGDEENMIIKRQTIDQASKQSVRQSKKRATAFCLSLFMLWGLFCTGCGSKESANVRVGSLKGPTSVGILFLMEKAEKGETADGYEFRMATAADELLQLMAKGELDIALVPANAAAVLYQRTDGGVVAVDINTLGVLSFVSGSADISSVADLKGRTVYLTGKGTTPEASLKYILRQNGLTEQDYALEYKSEAAEVAAVLAENPAAVGLLPQPFATAAMLQNESLKEVLNMNEEWDRVQGEGGSAMVTGVTLVRREFLEEHEDAVKEFIREHRDSAEKVNRDTAAAAALAVQAGIVAKESIALEAIPRCSVTCVTGENMKQLLSGYLGVLSDFNPELVGGRLPGDDFYFSEQ